MRPSLPGREIALGKFTKYFNSRLRDDQFEPTVLQVDEHTSVSRPSRDRALLVPTFVPCALEFMDIRLQ